MLYDLSGEDFEALLHAANKRWTHSDELLARIEQQLALLVHVTGRAHFGKKWPKKADHKPYPRPGDRVEEPKTLEQPRPRSVHALFVESMRRASG